MNNNPFDTKHGGLPCAEDRQSGGTGKDYPFLRSPAVRLIRLTCGFASPPRDGFALIGKGSPRPMWLRQDIPGSPDSPQGFPGTIIEGLALHAIVQITQMTEKQLFDKQSE